MSFFKAYDMRGTFGTDFDLDTVARVGEALPRVVAKGRWLVGRDGRTTSEAIRAALVAGLRAGGAEVTDMGLATTPMVYFFTAEDHYDGSVMITASHNPPTDNGLKVSKAEARPVGYADGLDAVERIVQEKKKVAGESGGIKDAPSSDAYLARYSAWQKAHAPAGLDTLRFAVDCSNGMASLLAHAIYPNAIFLNDTIDGNFPAHSPNPLAPEAREQLAHCVRTQQLDVGVIFDGDADRAMFVDEKGDFVQPDYLIPIIARRMGVGPVVHDVRTSRGVIETLREMGRAPIMVPVGHAFAKPRLRETGAVCGGELAGHYYFRDFHGCDSGILAASCVLGALVEAKARGETFSALMQPITRRYANSGECNFRVEDKDAAIERALDVAAAHFPPERARTTMDGLRLEFDEGWINIRKSNTEPYLRLLVEARTREMMTAWLAQLKEAILAR